MSKISNNDHSSTQKDVKRLKSERTIAKKSAIYHYHYKKTGRYSFIGKNLLRVLAVILIFLVAVWVTTEYIIDLNEVTNYITSNFPVWMIIATLFISESFIGLAPPDLYIIWAGHVPNPYLMVLYLSLASYLGGVVAYFIGNQLYRLPKVGKWVDIKFEKQFKTFKKFSGLLIIVSALAPLPFSWVSVVSGVVKYPLKTFLLLALSRIVRFFLYASIVFTVV